MVKYKQTKMKSIKIRVLLNTVPQQIPDADYFIIFNLLFYVSSQTMIVIANYKKWLHQFKSKYITQESVHRDKGSEYFQKFLNGK